MKKIFSFLIAITLMSVGFSACSKNPQYSFTPPENAKDDEIAVVSFNCAAPWGNAFKGTSSSSRVKRFAAYMNAVSPDSIGTQEMNSAWMERLRELMPEYDSYGVKRGGDDSEKKSEMNTVFWKKEKFTCLDKGTFWLSETPQKESRYADAGCHRICTFVVLEDKSTKKQYVHMNTHLDNAGEQARTFGAEVLVQKTQELKNDYPQAVIVLSGDFNDYLDGPACRIISKELTAKPAQSNTYHDWGKITQGEPIDFIFTNAEASPCVLLNDESAGYISDHYGIYQRVRL